LSTSPPEAPAFPVRRTCPYHPPAAYREIGDRGPLNKVTLWDGRQVWLITGHATGRRLLSDPRLSSDRQHDEYPTMAPNLGAEAARKLVLVGEDPPEHDHHRRLLNPEFSLKHARALRPDIQRVVDGLVDDVEAHGRPADLVELFAEPLPGLVMSALLGIPYEDHAFFQKATAGVMQGSNPAGTEQAARELFRYLDSFVTAQEREPDEALVGRLVRHLRTGELTHDEVTHLAMVLLIAGLETTSSMIPLAVLALLDHPEQLEALRSGTVPATTAIEELLRITAVTDFAAVRWVTADIEIDGEVIRAGDGIVVSSTMVNRDPEVFPDPDRLDLARGNRQHLTFGYGIHQCLGQNLARLQLEIAFLTLFRRLPGLRLAVPAEELRMRAVGTMQGLERMPVTW
jgi:pentalenic acid synthase